MNADLDRTTTAVLAADQAHLTRMKEDAIGGPVVGGGYSGAASRPRGRAQEGDRERA